ncbi:MAG: hypothetical protein A3C70_01635 [Candidatus Zambryskibacteria bacterium RIFCSPHIGHO2_02_FULL_43_14]|uniref:POTRA domain-containing protein n=1 Tax=Candidatus Zambryskibacteria bacterium RIFCSPHIGHO2_02_FULL_43_14 TaxID=1802748 RepID=A0A1G2TI33_9BACT|nr:MAG: hypothetical protein A2829_01460 [Candidatus Zambryskibacteria bacterium RIFCSPHIGHO2_01_FULL_43_60]OHA96946.1 MAG: hypothetical protein A3C70_01635 [Candidatus Zambryskibacteria bacterium RIFCSPHIGHO2_02_FULL_43_14]OHB03968.1 MAG: hypothetical protein A3B03_00700 [Candidatus Zambryskibacteria bacterium RIFCSPLOWO2_01_FULL_42_41]
MKIVSSGRVLNSREFYEKKKRKKRIKLTLLFLGFISLLVLSIYFFRQERFLIVEVIISEESVVDREEIISRVKNLLTGYYLWFIPRANTFIYPRHVIEENLLAEFPKFKSVELSVSNRALSISVDERIPFALYCLETYNPTATSLSAQAGKCFFLDEEGLIFTSAPSFSGDVYFVYTTQDLIKNPLGQRLATIEDFRQLLKFIETLTTLNIHSVALEIMDGEYRLILINGGEIIWRRDGNLSLVRSNLEAFLSNDSIKAQVNFLDKILFLDLRIDNKVFYKFK